jgi:carbon-monoxide dehydrogenase small subunit
LSAVQQAFLDNAAFQCGYCTPGMIMLAAALLQQDPDPGEAAIRRWMGANICRCTGYQMIVDAVRAAAGAKS